MHAMNPEYMWGKRQEECISCDGVSPVCNCAAGEQCILTGRSCTQCAQIECIPNPGSSGGKSVNPGVIAGPVVAALIILGLAALWWLRRKRRRDLARVEELAQRARKAEAAGFHLSSIPGSPGPGSARSARTAGSDRSSQRYAYGTGNGNGKRQTSRSALAGPGPGPRSPDPNAPVNPEYYDENGAERTRGSDPFNDGQSIATANTDDRSAHVIPIRYIDPNGQELDGAGDGQGRGQGQKPRPGSFAARTLNEARNNLFKGNQAPIRPARSPDLNLRLNTAGQDPALAPPSSYQDLRSPTSSGSYRDSYLSENSGAPSYLSSATDIHLDAPKIVTSRQVQVGRLHQAEMVQFGRPQNVNMEDLNGTQGQGHGYVLSPAEMTANPFQGSQDGSHDSHEHEEYDQLHPQTRMPMSPATFGSRTLGSEVSGAAYGNASYRTLTPVSRRTDMDMGPEEGLRPNAHAHALGQDDMDGPPSSDGLRFSMGSLGYNDNRDSISTMGTGRYLAQAESGHAQILPPRQNQHQQQQQHNYDRESMASGRSGVDSVLHGFPMIPPGQTRSRSDSNPSLGPSFGGGSHSPIPQSTSVSTLDHAAMPSRPPTSYRPTAGAPAPSPANRNTQASLGLGSFPFVPPPNTNGAAAASADGPPTLPAPTRGRNTIGMSTTSEGLGDFDFSFDRDDQRRG